jgi:DNA-binding CsgD family transcriptional regulator
MNQLPRERREEALTAILSGEPIRECARDMGHSASTVRKLVRDALAFASFENRSMLLEALAASRRGRDTMTISQAGVVATKIVTEIEFYEKCGIAP